jgi:membrane dipeptidase
MGHSFRTLLAAHLRALVVLFALPGAGAAAVGAGVPVAPDRGHDQAPGAGGSGTARGPGPNDSTAPGPPGARAVVGGAGAAAGVGAGAGLPFIEDDYARALAEARRTMRPLFVDAWAPWCHTCLSLRAFVFGDPALGPLRARFVWASIDTEKPVNARFVESHPIDAWPTLFVVDERTGGTRRLYRGALRASELAAWLVDAVGEGTGGASAPSASPAARERSIEEGASALRRSGENLRCVRAGEDGLRTLPPGTAYLNVAAEGLTCATALAPGDPARGASAMAFFSSALETVVDDDAFPILADDRSSGFEALVSAAQASGDAARVRRLAGQWWSSIDRAAGLAPTAPGRAVFDAHRTEAALALQQPSLAIAALEASARDFPTDYNPPARLARLYLAAGRTAEARASIDRALRLVYGPRRQRLEAQANEIAAAERRIGEGGVHPTLGSAATASGHASAAPVTIAAPVTAAARAFHEQLLTLDSHLDTPANLALSGWDVTVRHDPARDGTQVDLPRMVEGGLDGGFWAIFTPQGPVTLEGDRAARDFALARAVAIREMVAAHPRDFEIAVRAADAARIAADHRRIVFLSLENGSPVEGDLSLLTSFYGLGVRLAGLVHFANNGLADSSTDPQGPRWKGLSEKGRGFVAEANRLGIVLDASHASDDVLDQLLELSRAPIVLSHSGVKAVFNHPRNIDDERLRRLASKGGVIQINFMSDYLVERPKLPEREAALAPLREAYRNPHATLADREALTARRREIDRRWPIPRASLDDALAHLRHAIAVAGIEHVGIGADLDGGGGVAGFEDAGDYPRITERLLDDGFTREDLQKLWSGNLLRVLRAAEDFARHDETAHRPLGLAPRPAAR